MTLISLSNISFLRSLHFPFIHKSSKALAFIAAFSIVLYAWFAAVFYYKKAEKKFGPTANKRQPNSPSYLAPKIPNSKNVAHTPSADFEASDTSALVAGQKVEHQKFGFGEVIKMEGAAHNPIATVKFEHNGEKKIMLNYARLRILG